jgi:hypothetical protein
MKMHRINQELALITCSYAPDFARCQRLCRSVDRWVSGDIKHQLIVPARDIKLFRSLESDRRSVVAVEDVVPANFWQLPYSQRWWLDSHGWPLRGWVLQQVTKLSANFATCAELLVFVDSDLQFIRPFHADSVLRDQKLRLHRVTGAKSSGQHLGWHHRAADLLGVPKQYFGHDYIGQLISWRSSQLTGLQEHLEYIHERPWHRGIARSLQVSEYILYGAYVESIVGVDQSGHFGCTGDLAHCCWFREEADALASGATPLRSDAVAVLLQSNLGLSDEDERSILQSLNSSISCPMEAL